MRGGNKSRGDRRRLLGALAVLETNCWVSKYADAIWAAFNGVFCGARQLAEDLAAHAASNLISLIHCLVSSTSF